LEKAVNNAGRFLKEAEDALIYRLGGCPRIAILFKIEEYLKK